MALTGHQYEISAGDFAATVVEVGAGLRSFTRGGADVTVPYGEDVLPPKCCGCTLVPWPNRIRGGRYTFDGVTQQLALTEPAKGNASHGLGRWVRWPVTSHETSQVTLELDVVPQTGYPFEVRVEVTYALDAEAGLTVSATARNHGSGIAPFGAGFHPYLSTRGSALDEVTVRIPARERLLLDEASIPVGAQPVDGTDYDLRDGRVLGTLRMDDGFTGLTAGEAFVGDTRLWFDETFRYLQVFTLDDLAGAGPGVAIEPMTCAADAFNSGDGLVVLDPGGTWTGSWGITRDK